MVPLLVLTVTTTVLRLLGFAGIRAFSTWRDSGRVGVVVMFLFTGASHFSSMKYDYAAMIPPPLTGALSVIYLTGLLQIAGAIGLLLTRTRRMAGLGLFLLLVALFPANVYAALNDVSFRGEPPTGIWLRALIQAVFIAVVWWSAVVAPKSPRVPIPDRMHRTSSISR
jgi:uncharacterized membrane protein